MTNQHHPNWLNAARKNIAKNWNVALAVSMIGLVPCCALVFAGLSQRPVELGLVLLAVGIELFLFCSGLLALVLAATLSDSKSKRSNHEST